MATRPGAGGTFEVRKGGATDWNKLRFITETSFTSTPAPETTETFLDEGEIRDTGEPGKPTFSVTVSVNDAALAYREIVRAFQDQGTLEFRELAGDVDIVVDEETASIVIVKASGVATASDDALSNGKLISAITPGRLLIIGANAYHIEELLTDTTFRVSYAGAVSSKQVALTKEPADIPADVVKSPFKLVDFQVITSWTGKVTDAGGTSRSGTTRNETIQGSCDDFPTKTLVVEE